MGTVTSECKSQVSCRGEIKWFMESYRDLFLGRFFFFDMDAFKELESLTLPGLYLLEVALYFRSKCVLIRGSDIHSYETTGKESYRAEQHMTVAFERLPSQSGFRFLNRLPDGLIQSDTLN
ncbi:hypothetical protein J6590_095524 [Homalodisca vitripennis]|nr:hypothetical protein J6590_095524 [Homalodisca vitripennis]